MSKNKHKHNQKSGSTGYIIGGLVVVLIVFGTWALSKTSNSPAAVSPTAVRDFNSLVGKPMPAIQLFDKNDQPYPFDSVKGKNVVLFFNEGIMCYPACWNQVAQLGKDSRFNSQDTVAFSVVMDQPSQWQEAIAKMPDLAKATVLFDQGGTVSRQFALLTTPSSMHRGAYPGHSYIVLDKQGIVRFVYDDPTMAINDDLLAQKIDGFNK